MLIVLALGLILTGLPLCAQRLEDMRIPAPLPPGATLVIGFLGGLEHWNDESRSVRQLVLNLRERPGVFAESVGNHRRRNGMKAIRRALDTNADGQLDANECASARIILIGQSLGGAAAVASARELNRLGIPVMLTVQVDSVGARDSVIPPNVAAGVNFYQHDWFTLRGQNHIRAADPERTRILGNFEASYYFKSIDQSRSSWARRTFGGSHAKMEQDPEVWGRVEGLIIRAIAR